MIRRLQFTLRGLFRLTTILALIAAAALFVRLRRYVEAENDRFNPQEISDSDGDASASQLPFERIRWEELGVFMAVPTAAVLLLWLDRRMRL